MDLNQLGTLLGHPVIRMIELAIAVSGLVLAFVFYYRSKRERRPCFGFEALLLVDGLFRKLPGIEIRYSGVPAERITVTRAFFWNEGRETIKDEDVAPSDPLRIVVPESVKALSATCVGRTQDTTEFEVGDVLSNQDGTTEVTIGFKFLDFRDGGVVQIVHSGPVETSLRIRGKIIGAEKIAMPSLVAEDKVRRTLYRGNPWAVGMLLLAMLGTIGYELSKPFDGVPLFNLIVIAIFIFGIVGQSVFLIVRSLLKRIPPEALLYANDASTRASPPSGMR